MEGGGIPPLPLVPPLGVCLGCLQAAFCFPCLRENSSWAGTLPITSANPCDLILSSRSSRKPLCAEPMAPEPRDFKGPMAGDKRQFNSTSLMSEMEWREEEEETGEVEEQEETIGATYMIHTCKSDMMKTSFASLSRYQSMES